MEEEIQNYSSTVMFRGTPFTWYDVKWLGKHLWKLWIEIRNVRISYELPSNSVWSFKSSIKYGFPAIFSFKIWIGSRIRPNLYPYYHIDQNIYQWWFSFVYLIPLLKFNKTVNCPGYKSEFVAETQLITNCFL